jgi:hypothetical protein
VHEFNAKLWALQTETLARLTFVVAVIIVDMAGIVVGMLAVLLMVVVVVRVLCNAVGGNTSYNGTTNHRAQRTHPCGRNDHRGRGRHRGGDACSAPRDDRGRESALQ